MEYGKADDAANKFEVVEMLGVNTGMRINLQCVVIVCGVFEQTVKWIEHLVRKEEEKLSKNQSTLSWTVSSAYLP